MAMQMLNSVAEKQVSLFGINHPYIAETKQYTGECLLSQGKTEEARSMYDECYKMRELFFSLDQIHYAESMVNLIRTRRCVSVRFDTNV